MKKRVVKKPDVRRLEILLAAQTLFEKKGYAKTSVESIIKKAGIAKGTFYYYFKAKQDILRALIEHIASEMEVIFNGVVEQTDLNAIDKLQKILRGPEKSRISSSPVMDILHKPENRELQEQLNIQSVKILAPLIAKILAQGKTEGIFTSSISVECVQLILAGSQFVLDSGLFEWSAQKRMVFLKTLQQMLEQLGGAKPGVLGFISKFNERDFL